MEGVLKQCSSSNMTQEPVSHAMNIASHVVRRRPWGTRRRTRSTGSLPPFAWQRPRSDDSSSNSKDNKAPSSLHQSDSDDTSGVPYSLHSFKKSYIHTNLESDSVNENFSPIRPNTRRKRKFKRMAVDGDLIALPSRSISSCIPHGWGKKKRVLRHATNCENRIFSVLAQCGKRKRSTRERPPALSSSMECDTSPSSPRVPLALSKLSIRDDPLPSSIPAYTVSPSNQTPMDFIPHPTVSSSSLSSSESDNGVFTNDEGREGDDEQSDNFGEAVGGSWSRGSLEDSDRDDDMTVDSTFHQILTGSLSDDAKVRYRMFTEGLAKREREIRGGRRRVRSLKPGFSVLTSANEKLSRFLQDPSQTELRLHPMQKKERDQLLCLADLYSLSMKIADSCPVLTKTSNTMRIEPVSLTRLQTLCDYKKRRKTPPNESHSVVDVGMSVDVPENSVGTQMLRSMGWDAVENINVDGVIQEPMQVSMRPTLHGLVNKSS